MPITDPDVYELGILVIGILGLGGIVVPLLLRKRLMTYPLLVVALGAVAAILPPPWPRIDPLTHGVATEHLAEIAVILALTTIGLKIDRPVGWGRWASTWTLLAVTMPLTILATAWLGSLLLGMALPAAVLLGAALAPTDPVLAGDVQTGPPAVGRDVEEDERDEVRFALTSESALNDGLAFPFTNLALLLALVGTAPRDWLPSFLLVEVGYRIAVGVGVGWVVGAAVGRLVLRLAEQRDPARGVLTLAFTLLTYGATELVGGYGFLAVFVTAYVVRGTERRHEVHEHLHEGSEQLERLASGVVLFLLGAAVADGILTPTTPAVIAVALAVVVVIRPLTGYLGMLGSRRARPDERLVIAAFGIRGLGSIYYLAHALEVGNFPRADLLWATVTWTILLSLLLHGVAARPTMAWLDRRRTQQGEATTTAG
ncbi:MAG: cation:proton antiporter [Nitriliruptor sp.]